MAGENIERSTEVELDFLANVSLGNYGQSKDFISKFGENPSLGTSTSEDIISQGGLYPFVSVSEKVSLVSSIATDTSAGTGAQSVVISGLDENFYRIKETIITNGITAVQSTKTYIRIFRAFVGDVGTSGLNNGDITIIGVDVPGNTYASILTGCGQTLMAIYTIPMGFTGYVVGYSFGVTRTQPASADVKIFTREFEKSWRIRRFKSVSAQGKNTDLTDFNFYIKLPEKSDIRLNADVSLTNTGVHGGFDILLIKQS